MTCVYLGMVKGFSGDSWLMLTLLCLSIRLQLTSLHCFPQVMRRSANTRTHAMNLLQLESQKQNCFSCAGLGETGCWTFLFWDHLWEKTGLCVCVCLCALTFLVSDLWQCPLFAALGCDLMRVQTDAGCRSWTSSHTRPILRSLSSFIYPGWGTEHTVSF